MINCARTVALSRQRGSGGSYVGRAVAERMGYRYIDQEMLRQASEYLTANDPGKAEPDKSWWARLGSAFAVSALDTGYIPPPSDVVYEGDLFETEQRLMLEIEEREVAVIVGRGAAQTLRGKPCVLSVFLHAPEAWRIARVQQVYGVAEREAHQMVRDSDRDRASFVRAIADVDWQDARAYDLSVDTAALGFDATVDLIVRAMNARGDGAALPQSKQQ